MTLQVQRPFQPIRPGGNQNGATARFAALIDCGLQDGQVIVGSIALRAQLTHIDAMFWKLRLLDRFNDGIYLFDLSPPIRKRPKTRCVAFLR
jgi:hypothetical protein